MATQISPLPWIMSEDKTTWNAELPDGRTARIVRLDDGASFLPTIHESAGDFATGPVFDGVLAAANWAVEYAARNEDEPETVAERLDDLDERVEEIAASMVSAHSIRQIADIFFNEGFKAAQAKMLARLDALEVRVEELEAARSAASV